MPKIGDKIKIVPSDNINCHYLNDGQIAVIENIETMDSGELVYQAIADDLLSRHGYITQFLDISDFKVIE